jgi:hypothetical protein
VLLAKEETGTTDRLIEIKRCYRWNVNQCAKSYGNKRLKGTIIPITNYEKSQTGKYGIFQLFR